MPVFKKAWYLGIMSCGHGAMSWAWDSETRSLVFDSCQITVVSGRASDLKCLCTTLVNKFVELY